MISKKPHIAVQQEEVHWDSCKHTAALCFSLVKMRDLSLALGEEACTAAL